MANGDGSLAGDMWKEVPAWVKVSMQVGAPTIAAGYLIWLFSTNVAGDVRELKVSVIQHVLSTDLMMQRLNDTRVTADAKVDVLIRIAQTQCVNAATDVVQRRNCIEAGR